MILPALEIKQHDETLPVPYYATEKSAGIDLFVGRTTVIEPRPTYVPLNISVNIPAGHFGLLVPRSSLAKKYNVTFVAIGIIDSDYNGDDNEILANMTSLLDVPVTIERGERVAQLVIIPYTKVRVTEVENLGDSERGGGFGSTG